MLLQTQNISLRPLTTAHLAQTMSLLELSGDELRQKVDAALATNPALELIDQNRCPHCQRLLAGTQRCPVCHTVHNCHSEEPIVFVSPTSDFIPSRRDFIDEGDLAEEWMTAREDLPTYILRQIAPELLPSDRSIAAHILTSLDEDGLLEISLAEIARYNHASIGRVQNVQRMIQHADPLGVGSCSPREALLVQIEILSETRNVPPLTARVIQDGMGLLSRRSIQEMARLLQTSVNEINDAVDFITSNLNPYPARAHWGETHTPALPISTYQNPDILISHLDNHTDSPLVVEIVSPYAGALRVNPLFRQIANQASVEKTEQWQTALDDASLLVKCLQQRDHTLVRLMKRLVVLQRKFIFEGDMYLEPITRAQLADELEVHESTISRAVAGKAVQLPGGKIIPLAKLFDRSLHVRTALLQIIEQEAQPLSDTQIAKMLIQQGYPVARRTVAKYRAMEGILPARLRQHGMPINAI